MDEGPSKFTIELKHKYFQMRYRNLYQFRQFKSTKEIRKNLKYGTMFWRTVSEFGIPMTVVGPFVFRRNYRNRGFDMMEVFEPEKWQEKDSIHNFCIRDLQLLLPKGLFTDEEWAFNYFTLMRKTYLEDPFWCFTATLEAKITDFDIAAGIVPGGTVPDSRILSRLPAKQYMESERVKKEYRSYRKQKRRLEDAKRRERHQTDHGNLHPCKAEDRQVGCQGS